MSNAVVKNQPTSVGFDGWRRKTDLVRIPPTSLAGLQHELMVPPETQIGRIGDPHMNAERRHGAMNQGPQAAYAARQQSGIFVFWSHDHAVALEGMKILRQGQRDARTATRERCIGDHILSQLRNERDARIFYAPD